MTDLKTLLRYAAVPALLLAFVPSHAGYIDIVSGAGKECIYESGSGLSGTCTTVEVGPHPAWQSPDPTSPGYGGVWVSYAETGYDGNVVAPTSSDPIFTIIESFTITSAGSIDFYIWADDTADLYFNLSSATEDLVFGANFAQGTCAAGQIGCEPNEFFNLTRDLAPGTYDITMSVYQIGTGTSNTSNPFGVLYSGRVTSVSEPATLALFGFGLFLVGFMHRRRRVAAGSKAKA